jgi:uncharacterized damage-inducible protein DinB
MNWTELLRTEMDSVYRAADGLMSRVDDDQLDWKPATGSNWMTTGQLLMHMTTACGSTVRGFITGDWGLPEGMSADDVHSAEMMPPAETMPTIGSVAEARELLAKDKEQALALIKEAGEDRLANEGTPAPWDPRPIPLGHRLLGMVEHLGNHRGQLYYYLKLQGRPVNTMTFYGMG